MRHIIYIIALFASLAAGAQNTVTRGLKVSSAATADAAASAPAVVYDTLTVTPGDTLIRVSGYSKPLRATRESMFVTSRAADDIVAVELSISYLDLKGRTLHERTLWRRVIIPPGQTRKVDIPSWDPTQTFFYHRGPRPRTDGVTPYDVRVRPLRYVVEAKPVSSGQK